MKKIITLIFAVLFCFTAFAEDTDDSAREWLPPCDEADLLLMPARVGDEFLYFGGAIPHYLNQGKRVQVVYMTSPKDDSKRMEKAMNALYDAGLRNSPIISDFPEVPVAEYHNAVAIYDEDAFLAFEVEQIRRFKPQVIIGQGDYGDGIQAICFETLSIAAELSASAQEYPESAKKYGAYDMPLEKVYLHQLADDVTMDWNAPLEKYSGKTAFQIARESYAQISKNGRTPEIFGKYDCRKFGSILRTGNSQPSGDFFDAAPIIEQTEPPLPPVETDIAPTPLPAVSEADIPQKSELPAENPIGDISSDAIIPIVAIVCLITAAFLRLKRD